MTTLQITLPPMPPALWPNFRSRSHWPRTRAIAKYRAEAMICALQTLGSSRPRAASGTVTLTLCYPNRRNWHDPSNVVGAFKAGLDGFVDAGVFADDDRVQFGPVAQVVRGERPLVVATVDLGPSISVETPMDVQTSATRSR